jgi:hypothetical protein
VKTLNWQYLAAKFIARAYLVGALAVSATHIVDMAHQLQLWGWQALTTPAGIDGVALLGLLARSRRFQARTRRMGLIVQVVASLLSLSCNILAGHTPGARIYGGLVVAVYVFSEWFADQLAPAPAPAVEPPAPSPRSLAAQKAAATRKANRTAAEQAAAQEARRVARAAKRLERELAAGHPVAQLALFDPAAAPVSPATA